MGERMENELYMIMLEITAIILLLGGYFLFWIIGICIAIILTYKIIEGGNNENNNTK